MAKSPHFERASRSHSSMSLNLISVDRSSIALSVLLCGAIVADSGQLPRLLRARRERPRDRRAAECSQQFPPSDGDCHTPLPCEVRKGNDTTPRARCPNCVAPGAGGNRQLGGNPSNGSTGIPTLTQSSAGEARMTPRQQFAGGQGMPRPHKERAPHASLHTPELRHGGQGADCGHNCRWHAPPRKPRRVFGKPIETAPKFFEKRPLDILNPKTPCKPL